MPVVPTETMASAAAAAARALNLWLKALGRTPAEQLGTVRALQVAIEAAALRTLYEATGGARGCLQFVTPRQHQYNTIQYNMHRIR